MQYLGVEYSVKHMPELDPDFIPFGVWLEAYARGAEKPLTIALERDQGKISVRETKIHGTPEMAEADYRYVERYVKFLLWSIGGFRIWICGDSALAQRLQRAVDAAEEHVRLRAAPYMDPVQQPDVSGSPLTRRFAPPSVVTVT